MSGPPLRRNEWVTVAEAARRLATNEMRVYQWVHRYRPAKKGRMYLFLDLEEIENRLRHPDAENAI